MSIPNWLAVLGIISLVLGFACAVVIGIDLLAHPQPMAIMNAVWPITALYFGPVAVGWYCALGRATRWKRERKLPFWKSIIVEATHCGAGCALGDLVAEFAIYRTRFVIAGSALLTDYVGDFVLALRVRDRVPVFRDRSDARLVAPPGSASIGDPHPSP
jgi:hypothetical protein